MYDEAAVEKLLDRSQEGEEERQEAMADYLESFKVATYSVKEGKEVSTHSKCAAQEGRGSYWTPCGISSSRLAACVALQYKYG